MSESRNIKLLLWRQCLSKRRAPLSVCCEILLPIAFTAALVGIFSIITVTDEPTQNGVFGSNAVRDTVQPLQLVPWRFTNENVRIAIVDGGAGEAFLDSFDAWCDTHYPGMNSSLVETLTQGAWGTPNFPAPFPTSVPSLGGVPPMSSIFRRFGSVDELGDYVEDPAYSTDNSVPLIYGGIVWKSAGPAFSYELLFNRSSTPDTRFPVFPFRPGFLDFQTELSAGLSNFEDSDSPRDLGLLAAGLPGALSWQQLVARFALNSASTPAERFGAPSATAAGNPVIGAVWNAALASVTSEVFNQETIGLNAASNYAAMRGVSSALNSTGILGAALDSTLMDFFAAERLEPTQVELAVFPVEAYTNNPFYANAGPTFGLFFIIFFALHVLFLTRGVVAEKESKLREGMRMMGLPKSALFTSWAIFYVIMEAFISLIITLIGSTSVWPASNFGAIWAMFFLLGLSVISFSFLVSVFFSKARLASILAGVLFFAAYFPYTGLTPDSTTGAKAAAALCPPSAFMLGFADILMTLENSEVGVVDTTIDTVIENWSFSLTLVMLVVDLALYSILAWYLDEVWPTEFGVQRPFYFPFTASYWQEVCACCSSGGGRVADSETAVDHGDKDDHAITGSDLVEAADSNLLGKAAQGKVAKIRGLRKEFSTPDGIKVAVDGLDMTMYEGQIFVLLGHNGAGKTTTISMMSGLLPPTAGDANIYGKSVRGELNAIRANMGVCPQHDVLWPDLTVKEHLYIFAGIKKIPEDKVESSIDDVIAQVGLTEKVDALSATLSGGQKRKLSVAIALIGDSKIVFLDEPTSGMDPYSRRSTWQILKNYREGRIMIMTTHFMDEADILGDRIAIMSAGKLRCLGSPMFLKQKFGVGYNLTLIKVDETTSTKAVEDVVLRHVSKAEVYADAGREISIRLPFSQSEAFADLFDELDGSLDTLGLETYGISVTTMEEVFLAVANDEHSNKSTRDVMAAAEGGAAAAAPAAAAPAEEGAAAAPTKALKLSDVREKSRSIQQGAFLRHFGALFRKRVSYFLRDWKSLMLQLVIPVLAVTAGLAIANSGTTFAFPDLELTVEKQYNRNSAGDVLTMPLPFLSQRSVGAPFQDLYLADTTPTPAVTSVFDAAFQPGKTTFTSVSGVQADSFGFFQAYADAVGCHNTTGPTDNCPTVSDFPLTPSLLNMSSYLLNDRDNFEASMYGAYALGDPSYAADTGDSNAPPAWGILSNSTGFFSSLTFMNYLAEFTHRSNDPAGRLSLTVAPLPFTNRQREGIQAVTGLIAAIITVIGFTFIPASFVAFVVKEREVGAKHQQLISGVSIPAYWLSTWLWDYITYIFPAAGTIIVAVAFDIQNFVDTEDDRLTAFILAFLVYGVMASAYAYMLNFLFKSASKALTILIMLGFVDFILVLVEFLLGLFTDTCEAAGVLRYIFMLSPGFALGNALLKLSALPGIKVFDAICDGGDVAAAARDPYTALEMRAVGENLVMMGCLGLLYFLIAIAIDTAQSYPSISVAVTTALKPLQGVLGGCLAPEVALTAKDVSEDPDVIAENSRCDTQAAKPDADDNDVIMLSHMRKVYPGGKVAVRDMSFGVPVGQVFGFLGINGAGKTSTLKMLSGDVIPTGGRGAIAGYDIVSEQPAVRRLLGYCPQFDALLELLTTREHLEMFARIKGVHEADVNGVVVEKMQQMGITQYEHKQAGTLSGGNKRKLSVAIALIGNPPVVLLDEPSTGMDPVARRQMWKIIEEVATKRKESSIILTTHSMEECEALCQKVGIMVGGKLRCLGSIQHIKDTHGSGFVLQAGMRAVTDEEVTGILERMTTTLGTLNATDGIKADHVQGLCQALGNPAAAKAFSPEGAAWALHAAMTGAEGSIAPSKFAHWWAEETFVDAFTRYITTEAFPGATRVERHGSKLRFKIPPQTEPLGRLFRRVESRKTDFAVQEYSLSQTTLEQVFNQFASHQEEEKGVARGMEMAVIAQTDASPGGAAAPVVAPSAGQQGSSPSQA